MPKKPVIYNEGNFTRLVRDLPVGRFEADITALGGLPPMKGTSSPQGTSVSPNATPHYLKIGLDMDHDGKNDVEISVNRGGDGYYNNRGIEFENKKYPQKNFRVDDPKKIDDVLKLAGQALADGSVDSNEVNAIMNKIVSPRKSGPAR